ncbi:MAG: PIG-L family deacetylase, partial [Gemmatimonadota bacterium]|nr:PIG-L family deacetylase [Gemmatimonadota bacterium]
MMRSTLPLRIGLLVAALALPAGLLAQDGQLDGLEATALQMRKLDGVKRVLMIGAHPDDEDTSLLAALAQGAGAETAYLSLTRGEGGQNLIGPEQHEGLGIIRTGELVSARRVDGGRQFFTRAFDFGYSKNIEEALAHWPEDDVMRDVVYVVRKFRPHVIVAVFSGTTRDGHGQHQVAGVAATAAFEAAGDPQRFPELSRAGVAPWTPSKLFRSARFSPQDATASLETGRLDPVIGRSYFQVAMESRSQHRSQDMGASQYQGPRESALQLIESRVDTGDETGIFAGIDTTFAGQLPARLPAGWPADSPGRLARYRHAIRDAEARFYALEPTRAAPSLMEARAILASLVSRAEAGPEKELVVRRMDQISEVILSTSAVVTDVRVGRSLLTPDEGVIVDVNVWNGGPWDVESVAPSLLLPPGWAAEPTEESALAPPESPFFRPRVPDTPADGRVPAGSIARWSYRIAVPDDASPSAPYYLETPRSGDLYTWPEDPSKWALPFDESPIGARVSLALERPDGSSGDLRVVRRGVYVGVDKAEGEYRQRPLVVPGVSLRVEPRQMVWPTADRTSRTIAVIASNAGELERTGSLSLEAPEGFRVEPASVTYALAGNGSSAAFVFEAIPEADVSEGFHTFNAVATDGMGRRFAQGHEIIDYPHIPRALLVHPAQVTVSAFSVVADTDLKVGYIMGSGDDGATALDQLGMTVTLLSPEVVREGAFDSYDVLVLGAR